MPILPLLLVAATILVLPAPPALATVCPTPSPFDALDSGVLDLAIPDADATGVSTPPIAFDPRPGAFVTDVAVDLDIEHTWIGDLVVTLEHTDSEGRRTAAHLVDRTGDGECFVDFVSGRPYRFHSDGEDLACGPSDAVPPGCYDAAQALDVFDGIRRDEGSWRLLVRDLGGGDSGTLHRWTLHVSWDGTLAVASASWGRVKSLYR